MNTPFTHRPHFVKLGDKWVSTNEVKLIVPNIEGVTQVVLGGGISFKTELSPDEVLAILTAQPGDPAPPERLEREGQPSPEEEE